MFLPLVVAQQVIDQGNISDLPVIFRKRKRSGMLFNHGWLILLNVKLSVLNFGFVCIGLDKKKIRFYITS